MLKKLSTVFIRSLFLLSILLVLLFPLCSFKIGFHSEIFPALEIILTYYFITNYEIKLWQLLIAGLLFDQLYSMPIGTNSLVFILANFVLALLRKWFLLKTYEINFLIFYGYCLCILYFRYLVFITIVNYPPNLTEVFFQYLTTVFSYPLIRVFLDQLLEYLKYYAR